MPNNRFTPAEAQDALLERAVAASQAVVLAEML
jgi:hypothetical protein